MTVQDFVSAQERLRDELHEANKWNNIIENVTVGVAVGAALGMIMLVW